MNRPPEIHDLIGDEATPEERARLEQVHELLVAAGPPPPGSVPAPPDVTARVAPLRRRWVELASVAALVCVAVGAGYLVGGRGGSFAPVATVAMHAVGPEARATAQLEIGRADSAGNVPIHMRVAGLPRLPSGGWYELYLSKNGRTGESCGTFTTASDNTVVRLSVAYDLAAWRKAGRYDGWVVTAHVPGHPTSAKHILLTT